MAKQPVLTPLGAKLYLHSRKILGAEFAELVLTMQESSDLRRASVVIDEDNAKALIELLQEHFNLAK